MTFRRMNFCHGICNRQLGQSAFIAPLFQPAGIGKRWGTRLWANWIPGFSQKTPSLCPIVESRCFTFRLQTSLLLLRNSLRHVTHVTWLLQTCHLVNLVSSFVSSNRKKQKKSWMEVIGVRSYVIGVMFFLQQTALRLQIKQEHQFHLKRGSS